MTSEHWPIESLQAGNRIFKSAQTEVEAIAVIFAKLLQGKCESPIEITLGAAICFHAHLVWSLKALNLIWPWQQEKSENQNRVIDANTVLLVPQFKLDFYRFDFALTHATGPIVLIECDGHDFHERTKEQAAHDRQKDRFTQIKGIPILRYTGSEIYADPYNCACQILEFVEDAINAKQPEIAETAT